MVNFAFHFSCVTATNRDSLQNSIFLSSVYNLFFHVLSSSSTFCLNCKYQSWVQFFNLSFANVIIRGRLCTPSSVVNISKDCFGFFWAKMCLLWIYCICNLRYCKTGVFYFKSSTLFWGFKKYVIVERSTDSRLWYCFKIQYNAYAA